MKHISLFLLISLSTSSLFASAPKKDKKELSVVDIILLKSPQKEAENMYRYCRRNCEDDNYMFDETGVKLKACMQKCLVDYKHALKQITKGSSNSNNENQTSQKK